MRVLIVFLFLIFTLLGCAGARQEIIGKPVSGDPYIWDFGQAKEGVVLKHSFIFKNESKKVVNIKDVNTSCGCTASEVKKKTLLPGEEAQIEVSFKSQGYSGAVQQFVYVNTDNLDNPIVKYIIKAEVIKGLSPSESR